MIKIFYRLGSEIKFTQSQTEFAAIGKEKVLWIDLLDPAGDEKRAVEAFLGTEVQTRAEAEEIESSSRFSEEGDVIFANTNFLSPADDEMLMDPVSFILSHGVLTTLREIPLRSFDVLQNKMQARPELFQDGWSVFVEIMDKRVDLDADIVELLAKDVNQFSKRINQKEDINEEFLLDINQLQENAMNIRENVVDKQRLLSNLIKSKRCPKDPELREDLNIIIQDIASLINHINFTFERLEYLQDTVVGIINLGVLYLVSAGAQHRRWSVPQKLKLRRVFLPEIDKLLVEHAEYSVLRSQHSGYVRALQRGIYDAVHTGIDNRGRPSGLTYNAGTC